MIQLRIQTDQICEILYNSQNVINLYGGVIVANTTTKYPSIQFSLVNTRLTLTIGNITIDDSGVYMSRLRNNDKVLSSVLLVVTGKLDFYNTYVP